MKKVLIFYASYGGGHLSAAKSILKYITEHYTDVEVEMIDCMKYINKPIERVTTGAYREMAKRLQDYGEKCIPALKRACFPKLVRIAIS